MNYRRMFRFAPLAIGVALAGVACAIPHLALAATTSGPNLTGVETPFTGLLDSVMKLGGWAVAGTGVAALGGGLLGQQKDPKHSEIYHQVLNYAGGATLGGFLVAVGGPAMATWIQGNLGGTGALLH